MPSTPLSAHGAHDTPRQEPGAGGTGAGIPEPPSSVTSVMGAKGIGGTGGTGAASPRAGGGPASGGGGESLPTATLGGGRNARDDMRGFVAGDTERPPSMPFGPEPGSGIGVGFRAAFAEAGEPTTVGAPPDALHFEQGQFEQAQPRTGLAPPNPPPRRVKPVAGATVVGGIEVVGPPPAAAPVAPPTGAPPSAPFAPSGAFIPPAPHVATMLHAGGGPPPTPNPPAITQARLTRHCTACDARYPADFLVCPRDATPLTDEAANANADPLVGVLIGETYQIVRVVGEGGMGRVYEARHLRLKERRFAVKTLHADLARSPEIVARFMREAESASSLSHPHVVDVFDVHHLADGTPYLVGEFLDGEELAVHVAARGPLAPRMVAAIGRQVCSALATAHAHGIVHRDMKPENVFVLRSSIEAVAQGTSRDLQVKVLDFGISKAGGPDRTHLTRTGVIMGTPSYMSPEQARGRNVDLRADVYSLGAVLYFALTGRKPFDSDDPTSTLSMVLTQDPLRPRAIDPRIPEVLELIVQRAMAKEPSDRYASMEELERALGQFEHGGELAVRSHDATSLALHGPNAQHLDLGPHAGRSGPSRAFDVAKMILGAGTPPPMQAGNLAQLARPTIAVASVVLGLWLVGGTTAALAGLVRVLHDGEVTLTESVLLVVGCLFAALTPGVLYVLHVKRVVWPNSVRSLQLAEDLRRTATTALVTYGGLSIIARIAHTVFFRNSKALTSGGWDIVLLLVSVLAAATVGGFAPLVRNLRRRRS